MEQRFGQELALDADITVRRLVAEVLRASKKSRSQIADELSVKAGRRITKSMLDDYTAQSKDSARFPAALIEPLCEVTSDDRLQRLVIGARLRKLLELGESDFARQQLRAALLAEEGRR